MTYRCTACQTDEHPREAHTDLHKAIDAMYARLSARTGTAYARGLTLPRASARKGSVRSSVCITWLSEALAQDLPVTPADSRPRTPWPLSATRRRAR